MRDLHGEQGPLCPWHTQWLDLSACSGNASVRIESDNAHPTIRREYPSVTNAVYTKPPRVWTYVMSATHRRLGSEALNSRLTRSDRASGPVGLRVVMGAPPLPLPDRPARCIRRAVCSRPISIPSRRSARHIFRTAGETSRCIGIDSVLELTPPFWL